MRPRDGGADHQATAAGWAELTGVDVMQHALGQLTTEERRELGVGQMPDARPS